jgi:hypothetical protein
MTEVSVLVLVHRPGLRDARHWIQVAVLSRLSLARQLGQVLSRFTSPGIRDADEQLITMRSSE